MKHKSEGDCPTWACCSFLQLKRVLNSERSFSLGKAIVFGLGMGEVRSFIKFMRKVSGIHPNHDDI